MAGIPSYGLFAFVPTQARDWYGVRKVSISTMACMVFMLCAATAVAAPTKVTFSVVYNFCPLPGCADGYFPMDTLVQATDGEFYGTTAGGGLGASCSYQGGCGTVFRIGARRGLTTLYSFCSQSNCTDGSGPAAGLVQGADGSFYGITTYGGDPKCDPPPAGCGTVFKITSTGELTTLHRFCSGSCKDGAFPQAALVQGTDGSFYGTTTAGTAYNAGTIFKITTKGELTTLYAFNSSAGYYPAAALVQATDGNFYGTTVLGGLGKNPNCEDVYGSGCGTIFRITPKGKLTTLYNFCVDKKVCTDGANPATQLIEAGDGSFYGTTPYGGTGCAGVGCGTVFRITRTGQLTTLHSFDGSDGEFPNGALVQANDENFYGTTYFGGTSGGVGSVFRITPRGALTTLHSFDITDGWSPDAGLLQATSGTFYGTTELGGVAYGGVIFSVSVGLPPFVMTEPTSDRVGAKVIILGNRLKGATRVTFHGTAAKFKIASGSEIITNVPTGATTGKVKVKTPSGTLVSNVVFRVTK